MNRTRAHSYLCLASSLILFSLTASALAEVSLPAIFGDHMVLQREQPCHVWGTAAASEEVTVAFAEQSKTTTANDQGQWRVVLDPLVASNGGELTVTGENTITLTDVAVGEVWVCSGQSNMQWAVQQVYNAELNLASANQPNIRLISIHSIGTQTPRHDFDGAWERATPDAVAQFSAVGYLFGKRMQEVLGVPVGLIDNAWGGSAAEAWVPRDRLSAVETCRPIIENWAKRETPEAEEKDRADFEKHHSRWRRRAEQAKNAGRRAPEPPYPGQAMLGQHRPANLFNARVTPIAGLSVRGVIWYQGETNAGRAEQYRDLFPLLIESWRDAWSRDDLPFYWVQLADYMQEVDQPGPSEWAELREAQTMTLDRLPNTGQAVIIDIGNGVDIHPRNKQEVANRLARIALNKNYGLDIQCESPRFASLVITEGKAVIKFADAGRLRRVDTQDVQGFAIAGEDQIWHAAQAKITEHDTVEVWSDQVAKPVAVRYAWADNPKVNLYSDHGLPVTPFRTDDWPGVTVRRR